MILGERALNGSVSFRSTLLCSRPPEHYPNLSIGVFLVLVFSLRIDIKVITSMTMTDFKGMLLRDIHCLSNSCLASVLEGETELDL